MALPTTQQLIQQAKDNASLSSRLVAANPLPLGVSGLVPVQAQPGVSATLAPPPKAK